MKLEITNGATVSRMHGSDETTEFLAAFQYEGDAKEWAQAQLAKDATRSWTDSSYVVVCHSSGAVWVYRPKTIEVKAA